MAAPRLTIKLATIETKNMTTGGIENKTRKLPQGYCCYEQFTIFNSQFMQNIVHFVIGCAIVVAP
jgi:hypothetical protein